MPSRASSPEHFARVASNSRPGSRSSGKLRDFLPATIAAAAPAETAFILGKMSQPRPSTILACQSGAMRCQSGGDQKRTAPRNVPMA